MFGRLKNLFRKRPDEEPFAEAPPGAPPQEVKSSPIPALRPPARPGARPTFAPVARPSPAPQTAPAPVAAQTPRPVGGDSLKLSLKPILLTLPDILKAKVRQPNAGGAQISVPVQKILPQLAFGSIKITFGELRQAAPAGVFTDASDQDQAPVELPLQEILSQLKPDQLSRRSAQKKLEIPPEVTPLFGPKGEALAQVRMVSPTSKPTTAPQPTAPGTRPTIVPAHVPAVGPATSAPAAPAPYVPIKPGSPLPSPAALKTDLPAQPIRPSQPLPSPAALKPPAPAQPIRPSQPLPTPQTTAPRPAAQPAQPAVSKEPLVVPLRSLIGSWPDAIKQPLTAATDATVALPSDEVEQGLKRGKIVFSWNRMRGFIKPPPPPPTASALDETEVELPLSVIAPLFLTQRKPAGPQKKYTIAEHIPDIFHGKALATSDATAPVAAAPAPLALPPSRSPAPAPAPARVAAPAPPQEIGEVFGQPGRKNWTPMEMVQRTSILKGVAGALIAMQDGLIVASHLPPGLNGETIAAFIPQMYSRVMQYCKELKLGEANNFAFIVDNVPLKIFKVGSVYFTVLGRAGEPLPEPHLGIVAAQLETQSK